VPGLDLEFVRELACAVCDRVTRFEQPPCLDGHGAECDEWACTVCGAAVLIGSYTHGLNKPSGTRQRGHRAA